MGLLLDLLSGDGCHGNRFIQAKTVRISSGSIGLLENNGKSKNCTMVPMEEYPNQYAKEDPRYVEVTEQWDRLSRNESFAKGRVLRQIDEEQIFGRWGNFPDCVEGRLQVKVRYARYLIKGADMFDMLEERGCQLPNSEHQIRSLGSLKDDDLRVLAWNRACQQKQQGSPPDYRDVWREVRRLLPTPDEESDEAYRAYRKLLESAMAEYRKAHAMLEEGELDGFISAEDKRSKQQRKRLLAMVERFAGTLDRDALVLAGEKPVAPEKEEIRQAQIIWATDCRRLI